MHPTVKRQLKKLGLLDVEAPSPAQWQDFLERVGTAYREAEQGRELLERSLALSSEEMKQLYEAQRQLSANQLAIERDKLQVLIQSLGVGVCALDRQGIIQILNHPAEQMLGATADAVVGHRFSDSVEILDGVDLSHSVSGDNLLQLVAHGTPFEHHDAWFRIGGTVVIPVSFVLSPIFNHDVFTGAVLVFQNITDRKRAEEERASRERLVEGRQAELLRLTKSPALQSGDLPGAFREITASAAGLLAVARASVWFFSEDTHTLTCADLFESGPGVHSAGVTLPMPSLPRYRAAVQSEELIDAHDAQTDPRTSEFTDAYLRPLGITSMLDAPIQWRGKLVGVVCHEHIGPPRKWTAEDLTSALSMAGLVAQALEASERVKSERALRVSEERTRLVLDTALDAVVGVDTLGQVNLWNRRAEVIFGWSAEEVLGRPLDDLIIPPSYREAHREGMRRFIQTGEGPALNRRLELSALRRDGSEFPIEISISPLKTGDTYLFSAFIQDISERKQLQQEMFQANQFMTSLIDSMPIMVFVKDAKDLTFIRWNQAAEELTGISRAEVLGKTDFDFFPPDQAEAYTALDRQALNQGCLVEIQEEAITTKHHGQRLLHTKKFPILDRNGHPQGLLGISEDITARRQAEANLRENEEKYRSLFESSRDAIVLLFPPAWTFTAANPAAIELFGARDLAHLTTLGPWSISPEHQPDGEASSAKAKQMIETALREGSHYFEWTHKRIDGHEFPATVLLTRITIQDQVGLQATVRDISAQKLAEDALRTSQARLTMTVQGSQVGIWDWNLATNSMYFSPEWKAQLGCTDHELGNSYHEWETRIHPEDLPEAHQAINAYLNRRTDTFELEHRLLHKDGSYRWILSRGSLFTDPATLTQRMVGIHIDVTDRRRAEEELRKAKEAAEAASRAKSQFLANMSHEIRTPMNGVIGMTELLKGTELTKSQRHYLDTIATSSESLLLLINDILDFSKIEAGKLELQHIDFDLRTVVESVIEQLASRAQQQRIHLAGFFHASVPTTVKGDPGRLRQILTNLVANAVKFTSKGEVVVRVMPEPALHADPTCTWLRISVTDSGIGISEEGLKQLFQTFSQVDGSSTRQYGGTGLGLAISKQLTELMGGRIGVESQLGKGSTFWLVLPLALQASPQTQQAVPPTNLKGKRICLVEAHRANQDILQHYVQSWGMVPIIAPSAADALQALDTATRRGEPVHGVVVDFQLPDMNGLALAELIRVKSELGPLPIVLMTALAQRGDGEAAVQAGCSAYLTKPIRYLDLYECLLQVLGHQASPRPTTATSLITRHSLAEARTQRRFHILVVEDNPVNQEVAALLLRNLGSRVDLANNGREAVEAASHTPYDLIFMDCQMPGMDGYAATCAIRKLEQERQSPRTPIVALTAHALQGDREECLAAGMDDYLTKPFTKERLHEIVEQWLGHRRGGLESPPEPSAVSASSTAPPALDPRHQEAVDRSVWAMFSDLDEPGQPDSLCHFMEIFLRDSSRKMDDLRQAVTAQDADTVSKIAHSLKSVSAVLGAKDLSAMYREMEASGRAAKLEPIQTIWPRVEDEFGVVCTIFREELIRRGADVP